jgi:ribosomal protein S27E
MELPPCPECGKRRVLFQCRATSVSSLQQEQPEISITSLGFFTPDVQLYACTCLGCGNTTLRPDPDDLKRLQKAAEKGHTIEF